MSKVITISREFGSGGREIGFRIASELGIPFYDKEIISMAAENSDIAERVFHDFDEKFAKEHRAFPEYISVNPFSNLYEIPISDQIFVAQSQVIRNLEKQGPCVIIGRCSDMIIEDGFRIYVCSSMKKRMDRIKNLENYEDVKTLEAKIRSIDKKRKDYYQYYSGNEWGNPRNYHISLNSALLGVDGCVELAMKAIGKIE